MSSAKLHYQLDLLPKSRWLTVTANPLVRASLLHVQEVGDFFAKSGYYTRREGLNSYLIKYTVSGEGVLEYGGQAYTVQPSQLFWIDCREAQYYHTAPASALWNVLWVHLYGPTSAAYYDIFRARNRGRPVVTLPAENGVAGALNDLIGLYQGAQTSLMLDVEASERLTRLMVEILRGTDASGPWLGVPSAVQQAQAYLADHFSERITLEQLSRQFAVSKFHFQKQFKRHSGYTPAEYLLQLRLQHAKEALRMTDRSVSQIACDVGMPNVSHFIALFKRQEGTTPAAYRASWRTG